MVIENKKIEGGNLLWILRCPKVSDAGELSRLRLQIDGETENLDREPGEGYLSAEDFAELIKRDSIKERNLFLVAEVNGKIVGFTRCEGNELSRFRHKAEFGICILKEYWGFGIGKVLLENVLQWAQKAGLMKITLNVVQTNEKAIALYKKFGFTEEGILIKDRLHKDGKLYNTILMAKFIELSNDAAKNSISK